MKVSSEQLRHRLLPILLGQAMGLACGIAGVKITSHLVPPATFGVYGVFLTFAPLGMWVVHAGLVKFINRHWAGVEDRAALLHEIARAAARKLPWLALAAGGAAFSLGDREGWMLFPAIFFAAALLAFAALAQAALQAAREHWRDFAVSSVGSITRSFLPPLFFLLAGGSALALYAGFCVHALVLASAGALALRAYWPAATKSVARAPQLTRIYEGPAFILLAIAGWTLVGLNRWIMALAFGSAETGYFALASNLATLIPSVLGTIFLQYFQPDLFAGISEQKEQRHATARRVDQTALLYTGFALLGLIVLRLVAPFLIGALIQETYRPALDLLLPSGCFMLAITTGIFFNSLLLAGKREAGCVKVDLTAAAVLVLGGIVTAALGEAWFLRWLLITPIVPWLVNRPLAHHFFYAPRRHASPSA